MSFILDALRKSELERQRDSAPGLMRSPVATVRREMPAWSWFLIVLLSLALVAVAAAWWLRDTAAGLTPAAEERALPTTTGTPAAPASETASDPASAATPAEPAATEAPVGDGAPAASPGEPGSVADLVRAHPSLPRYALSFLEYNGADPASSSVTIDGQRYYPGQVLEGGPTLVGVRPDGALLAWRGRTYLLTPR